MKVPVRLNGVNREAHIEYVVEPEIRFPGEWRKSLGKDRHPARVDAVEFAYLACKRFEMHSPVEAYAQRSADIPDHVRNNPYTEVAGLIVLKCDWFPESDVIGFAHFRRSWSNNLILDYLGAHPWIASQPPGSQHKVSGVGTALLFVLCEIADANNCGALWGEATQNSCKFYQDVFSLEEVRDLLYIPSDKMHRFRASVQEKWQKQAH